MSIRDRIGVDVGARLPVADAVDWAARHGVSYVDVRVDDALRDGVPEGRAETVRRTCEERGVHLGLHTESAVNVAETAPFLDDAVDEYHRRYVDLAAELGAEWIVVHGGYHFTADREARIEAALERLERVGRRAEATGVDLLLENHNPEPEGGEVHYLPVTVPECERYFDALDVGWAFTVNHAHMRPEGVEGFVESLDVERCGEVRLADNRGDTEEHLPPGEGTVDFRATFDALESAGFDGHYVLAYGTLDAMLDGRETLAELAP